MLWLCKTVIFNAFNSDLTFINVFDFLPVIFYDFYWKKKLELFDTSLLKIGYWKTDEEITNLLSFSATHKATLCIQFPTEYVSLLLESK